MVSWNSTSGGFAYIWQSKRVKIIAIKTERTQIYFLRDVLVALASLDLKVAIKDPRDNSGKHICSTFLLVSKGLFTWRWGTLGRWEQFLTWWFHLSCKSDQMNMRDCMDRRVSPPKRVTSPIWGPPPPCKKALGWQIQSIYCTLNVWRFFVDSIYYYWHGNIGQDGVLKITRGQFNRTFTSAFYKCSYCFQTLKQ